MQLEADQAFIKTLKEEVAVIKAKIKPAWQGNRLNKSTRNANYGNQVSILGN
jgi:hypothetical protein